MHRLIGEYKLLNFTTPFTRHRLVVRNRIRSQWSISTIICFCTILYEDYIILYIFLCLCSLPSILCCASTYFPNLNGVVKRLLLTTPFNAKWHFYNIVYIYYVLATKLCNKRRIFSQNIEKNNKCILHLHFFTMLFS